jgi:hypothetical protein
MSTVSPNLSGTATVTLNPPSGIAQQPKNTSVFVGETATFNVVATGSGITYQWQVMAPGAGSFTNLTGAGSTTSSYTPPVTTLANSGTQYRCVVTTNSGTFTSNAATLTVLSPGVTFITSKTLGSLHNNHNGWQGMSITVGARALTLTGGRLFAPGNNGIHILKLVDAVTGADIQGASVSVDMAGGSSGTFVYGPLASPAILNAGSSYYLVSQETSGGDQWYDIDTIAQTTTDGTLSGAVRGSPPFTPVASTASHPYGPVDFQYVALGISPTTTTLFGGQTQQFSVTATGIVNGVTLEHIAKHRPRSPVPIP